jgi:DNA-binding MarR family transcriptional regulator
MNATAQQAPTGTGEALSGDLCWLLARASHALMTEFTAALEGFDISPREHAVLTAAMAGSNTQTELARQVGLDKTTMVVTVDELEANGLAERVPSPGDRRARVIKVTPAGGRKVAEADEILDRVREDVLEGLPEQDREVFLRCLAQLASGRLSEPVQCAHPVRRRA